MEGTGRIDGLYCRAAARLLLDDGRRFEVEAHAVPQGATVQVRDGRAEESLCGQAPRLAGVLVPEAPRPVVGLTLTAAEWGMRAGDIDALSTRFVSARFQLVVTGDGAEDAVVRIAMQILKQRPDLLARASVEPGTGASGWRVTAGARTDHAANAADVARLLAAAR